MARSIIVGLAGGLLAGLAARSVLNRALLSMLGRDVDRLNAGDPSGLSSRFADDSVLHFHDGPHRFAGPNGGLFRGRDEIAGFLGLFVRAGVRGEVKEFWTAGPPWRLTVIVRFDDHADGPSGQRRYENRTVLVLRFRGLQIIDQQDFFVDTQRIADFDAVLEPSAQLG